ncbi:MAG: hypothetical protein AB7G23_18585 [Vicinamibacterales bacterium]
MMKAARPGRRPHAAWALLVLLATTGGCARSRPDVVPDGPPLAMPLPPPRVLAPVEEPLPATTTAADAEPPQEPPRTPPARTTTRRPPQEPRAEAPPAPEEPGVAAAPSEPPRELRPAASAGDVAAERAVRDLLTRASRDLTRVDYGRLSRDLRAQYDLSKRFVQQAEQAIRERNFLFASTLADKAASLATGLLAGR